MTQVVISTFKGLKPKREDATQGIVLPAQVASNVDLRNSVIKPFNVNTIESVGHSGEIIKVDDDWLSGKKNYAKFQIRGFNVIIYKDGQKWKRIARQPRTTGGLPNVIGDLGLATPEEPLVDYLGVSGEVETVESPTEENQYESAYAISWLRNTDGFEDESGLSAFTFYSGRYVAFSVKRPTVIPDNVYGWNIYRLDRGYRAGSAFRLVAEKQITDLIHKDYLDYDDLREVPDGLIDDNGITVLRTPPPVVFDGMSKNPYFNYFIGWKNNEIFFSEPNNIDSFPVQYRVRVEDNVLSIEPYSGDLYIFTEKGVLRGVGIDPLTMRIMPQYIGDRIGNRRASIVCEMGLFYATRKGLNRVTGGNIDYVSRVPLGDEYFKDIDPESMHFNYTDGIIYLFHNKGALLFIPENGIGFIFLTDKYNGSHYDGKTGLLFGTKDNYIQALFQGDEQTEMVYETGDLTLNEPDRTKYFEKAEFFGEGKIFVELYLDGELRNSLEMDLDGMDRDRELFYPRGYTGRSGSYKIRGKGTVKEVKYWLYDG